MLAVLEHIEPDEVPELLRRIFGKLRPGGSLIITTPPRWTWGLLNRMASVGLVSKREIDEHKRQYTPVEVLTLLYAAGFDREKVEWSYYDCWTNMWFKAVK